MNFNFLQSAEKVEMWNRPKITIFSKQPLDTGWYRESALVCNTGFTDLSASHVRSTVGSNDCYYHSSEHGAVNEKCATNPSNKLKY